MIDQCLSIGLHIEYDGLTLRSVGFVIPLIKHCTERKGPANSIAHGMTLFSSCYTNGHREKQCCTFLLVMMMDCVIYIHETSTFCYAA